MKTSLFCPRLDAVVPSTFQKETCEMLIKVFGRSYITRSCFPECSHIGKHWITILGFLKGIVSQRRSQRKLICMCIFPCLVCESTCYCSTALQTLPSRAGNYMGSTLSLLPPSTPRTNTPVQSVSALCPSF